MDESTAFYEWASRQGPRSPYRSLYAASKDGFLAGWSTGSADVGRLREQLAAAYIKLSGMERHASDCATSRAPAMDPGPCDCSAEGAEIVRACNAELPGRRHWTYLEMKAKHDEFMKVVARALGAKGEGNG